MFFSPEFKVGLLVIVVSALIAAMSLKLTRGPGMLAGSKRYHFLIDDASGLVPNSAVRMAGIKVGIIEEIKLEDGKARVRILLNSDTPMTTSGYVALRSQGILGDKNVELFQGNPTDPTLANGSEIRRAETGGSLDDVMQQVGKIAGSLTQLADNLTKATSGAGDSQSPVGRIILNIEKVSADLAKMTGNNGDKIDEIIQRVQNISRSIDELISDEGPDGFKVAWQNAVDSLKRVDRSLQNIEEITDKVNRGEGTVGRLINDESTVDELNTAIENVNKFLGGAQRMETSFDFHTEYLTESEAAKSFLGVKIQPGLDRFYELHIVDDPEGVTTATRTETTTDGGPTTTVDSRTTNRSKTKFTALFGKNFYDFTIKGGLFESAGGIGLDYHLFNRRLRLSLEAFDFQDTNIRAFARYNVLHGLYLIGGVDDALDDANASAFAGAGLFLTNDDIKMLATQIGMR
jgi:phospholipid/cholesterol/gamma-HCH transport system substrate-binding protein